MPEPVFRFAPSPNGYLHPGHACSALLNQRAAREAGGRLLLRIEDIDQGRCREAYVEAIHEDLEWLGIGWERPVVRQSERFTLYGDALQKLREKNVLYPCFATRSEIVSHIIHTAGSLDRWPRDPDGAPLYPGLYKDIPARELNRLMWEGTSYTWRLDMDKAVAQAETKAGKPLSFLETGSGPKGESGRIPAAPRLFGDVVLARKDVPASYHIAVVVDDAAQGITHIVRGQDLFYMTSIHRVLQVLLDLPEPVYQHHPLVRDATGRRLSKTARDKSLRALRAAGATPDSIAEMAGIRKKDA